MNHRIQPCRYTDLLILRDISCKTFIETYQDKNKQEYFEQYIARAFSEVQLSKELNNPNSYFYFIYLDDHLAGYIKLNINDSQTENLHPKGMEIERIYVLSSCKGRGLGKQLLQWAKSYSASLNKNPLWLGVWTKNSDAIAFYQHMGFHISGKHSFFMGDDEQLDYIMQSNIDHER